MIVTCPNCQADVQASDTFCPQCGQRLAAPARAISGGDDYHPLPGVVGQPDLRIMKKRRPKRRPWYRSPLVITLALIAAVVLVGSAGAMFFIQQQFEAINEISTPPPVVSLSDAEEGESSQVDTSPAQKALAVAESGATGEFILDTSGAVEPLAPETTTSDTSSASNPEAPEMTTNDESGVDNPAAPDTEPSDESGATGPIATETQPDTESLAATGMQSAGEGSDTGVTDLTGDDPPADVAEEFVAAPREPATFTLKSVQETEGDSLNILLMGVDARPGEPIDAEVRPDSLSVLHLDGETGACRILSVPRDTRTELPGYGLTKINHALAVGGIPYQMLVVEQLLGIELDHYGLIDFSGIEGLVEVVGGVTVDNPTAFEAGGMTFAEGQITLNGEEALTYARFRYDEEGDFGRQKRQQQIIRALISQTDGMDVVRGANRLLSAVDGHFKSDLSPRDMIGLARDFRSSCTSATLETETMVGAIETHPDPLLNLDLSYVTLAPNEIVRGVEWLLEGE